MRHYLRSIPMLLIGMVIMLGFNNCTKMQFSSVSDSPVAKAGGSTASDTVTEEELAEAEVDADKCEDGEGECYALCHVPPGNFEAMHTIYVGRGAIEAHLKHHISHEDADYKDHLGECGEEAAEGDDDADEEESAEDGETAA